MASIRENKKKGKTVSYRFTACLERDVRGKQIRRYTTWKPPEGLTPAKSKKAAERAANEWEERIRAEFQKEKEQGSAYRIPPAYNSFALSSVISVPFVLIDGISPFALM